MLVKGSTAIEGLSGSAKAASGVARGHAGLDRDGALHRLDHAGELDQRAIAHELDEAAVVGGDLRVDHLAAMGLEAGERAGFVGLH